jgi:tetratricopeptide (TPR) repeat protein
MTFGVLLCASALAFPAAASQNPPAISLPALDLVPAAARDMIRRAFRDAEARPADVEAAGRLGRVLHAWEQWEPAHDAYRRAQSLAPRAFEWPYLDGVVLQRLARHADAAAQLRQAVAINPAFTPARVKLADALFEAGLLGDSERLAADLAKDPATEPIGQYVLGRVAAAAGRHQAAVDHLQRAVQLFPEWGAAYYALGLSYRALDRREDARRALERHAEYGPLWPGIEDPVMAAVSVVRDDPGATLARGISLAGKGDLAAAIAAHEAALAADPGLTQAHANLISLYGRTQQWAQAEAHYRALVALGEVGNAHYDYGVLLGLQQRWSEAAAAYRLAIAVNPLNAPAHNNLGEALERQGDFGAALEAYRQAVACAPEFRAARFNAGRLLLRAGRADEAIAELSRLADGRDATAPRVLFTLALAYAGAGRKDEARKWAAVAHQLAIEHGQPEVAAAIARDFAPAR